MSNVVVLHTNDSVKEKCFSLSCLRHKVHRPTFAYCHFIPSALPEFRWQKVEFHLSSLNKLNFGFFFFMLKIKYAKSEIQGCAVCRSRKVQGKRTQKILIEILVSNFRPHVSKINFSKFLWSRDHMWGLGYFVSSQILIISTVLSFLLRPIPQL